jgi:hypothetical protein
MGMAQYIKILLLIGNPNMGNTQYGNGHVTICSSGVMALHHTHSWPSPSNHNQSALQPQPKCPATKTMAALLLYVNSDYCPDPNPPKTSTKKMKKKVG